MDKDMSHEMQVQKESEHIRQTQEKIRQAIKPYLNKLCDLYDTVIPAYIMTLDKKHIERIIYPPEFEKARGRIEKEIKEITQFVLRENGYVLREDSWVWLETKEGKCKGK